MTIELNPFKTLSSRIAWSCPWYQVRQDEIVTPDGRAAVYNVIEKPPAVWIVPITTQGQLAMVHQFRYTVGEWCLEVPAGSVKPGQTIEEAARDELREEVGGTAASLEYMGRFYLANGICNEVGHIFLAAGVVLGNSDHEAAEVMSIALKSPDEAIHMARTGKISDGPSALALLLCADMLAALKPDES
ncbi:MAG: NUDIX hydrolase [Anaerolineales bacterium]|uniref:NUDIX hydrolase n=1 Tax=Promineifilum sp. TaxID=2664178 RepID=UPI001DD11385|nr:NUDIX hydrolase [Anaerolineales bacterium]MCB8935028.1 NUDIX hydrolase [Promineifilum sp.]MCO5181814.1 NUDIX hydrolase [Promineifilum sp.]